MSEYSGVTNWEPLIKAYKQKESDVTKKQKKMIKKHKERMYRLRVFNEDWQAIHQRRWEDDSPCWNDECDCEESDG